MSVRKFKPESYSAERRLDSNFIHAEKLAKSAKETVERSKQVLRRARLTLREIKRKEEN